MLEGFLANGANNSEVLFCNLKHPEHVLFVNPFNSLFIQSFVNRVQSYLTLCPSQAPILVLVQRSRAP